MLRILLVTVVSLITVAFLAFHHAHQVSNLMSPTTDLSEWQWNQYAKCSGNLIIDQDALECQCLAVDGDPAHLTLFHRGIVLQSGHKYRISFFAKADRIMKVSLTADQGNPTGASANIGLDTYYVFDQEWKRHEEIFTPVGIADHAVTLPAFGLGNVPGNVWFKDVVVEKVN